MELLIVAILIGLIPAAIASSKGHSFILWWFFGTALFIAALPLSFFLKNKKLPNLTVQGSQENQLEGRLKKCPFCVEKIQLEAIKCRFCGGDLTEKESDLLFTVNKENKEGEFNCNKETLVKWLNEDRIQKFDKITDPRDGSIKHAFQFSPGHFKTSSNPFTKDFREWGQQDQANLQKIFSGIISLFLIGFLLWLIL